MSYSSLMHTHKGIIYLFLAFILIKFILMLVSKSSFTSFRDKTKMVDMILGTGIIVTGVILIAYRGWNVPEWLWVKFAIFIVATPLAIVGMKKRNVILVLASLLLFVYAFLMAKKKSVNAFASNEINTECPSVAVGDIGFISNNKCTDFHAIPKYKGPEKIELTSLEGLK